MNLGRKFLAGLLAINLLLIAIVSAPLIWRGAFGDPQWDLVFERLLSILVDVAFILALIFVSKIEIRKPGKTSVACDGTEIKQPMKF